MLISTQIPTIYKLLTVDNFVRGGLWPAIAMLWLSLIYSDGHSWMRWLEFHRVLLQCEQDHSCVCNILSNCWDFNYSTTWKRIEWNMYGVLWLWKLTERCSAWKGCRPGGSCTLNVSVPIKQYDIHCTELRKSTLYCLVVGYIHCDDVSFYGSWWKGNSKR